MSVLVGFGSLGAIPERKIHDKVALRMVAGEKGMIVWWSGKAGAHLGAHAHPHEQIVWIISGRMDVRLGAERRAVAAGDVIVIPGGVEHEAWWTEDAEGIDVYAPRRDDLLGGAPPSYLRQDQ